MKFGTVVFETQPTVPKRSFMKGAKYLLEKFGFFHDLLFRDSSSLPY